MVVSVSGTQFRIVREKPDVWANYDPERARAGLEGIVGMLKDSDIDFEAWKQEIREQRGQYSIGRPYDKE